MNRLLRFIVKFAFSAVMCVTFVQAQEGEQENCAVPIFYTKGQVNSMRTDDLFKPLLASSRSIDILRSITAQPTVTPLTSYEIAKPDWVISSGVVGSNGFEGGSNKVLILVIDDFTKGVSRGSGEVVSHGTYVMSLVRQIRDLITDELSLRDEQQNDLIEIRTLDIGKTGYKSSEIASQILELTNDYSHVVLNMSFAFVPCKLDVLEFNFDSFLEGFSDAGNDANNIEANYSLESFLGSEESALRLLETSKNLEGDALQTDLAENFARGDLKLISIAAAGNYGRDPYAPASWENVLSVSANVDNNSSTVTWENPDANLSASSSKGQVMVPGAWYLMCKEGKTCNSENTALCVQSEACDLNKNNYPDYVAGTSFSAPVLSVLAALYLTNENNTAEGFTCRVTYLYSQNSSVYGYYYLPDSLAATESHCFP